MNFIPSTTGYSQHKAKLSPSLVLGIGFTDLCIWWCLYLNPLNFISLKERMDLEKVHAVLKRCYASDGTPFPIDLGIKVISKIVSEQYVDADNCRLKIYIYSKGKVGNNKPYEYETLLADERIIKFKKSVIELRKSEFTEEEDDPWS